jgi:hypothetical protein
MSVKRCVLRAAGAVSALGVLVMLFEQAKYSWDDWAALVVQRIKGPLMVTVVNATATSIPVVEVRSSGFACQMGCVGPGERRDCKLQFREPSLLSIRMGDDYKGFPRFLRGPPQQLPVFVTWRSHGVVEVVIADAGVSVVGHFADEFP